MTTGYNKPLPTPNNEDRAFWEAMKRHEPVCQRCGDCGTWLWLPLVQCPRCYSFNLIYEKIRGAGKVYSYSIVNYNPAPLWQDAVPYILAVVELEEGVRMKLHLVNCPVTGVKMGMAAKMTFKDVTPEWTLPQFEPMG